MREIEFDPRMIGMVAALGVIWLGFNWLSDGAFLTPRNLWNLLVQTASIAVMACGMVLVIVTRNIDLSVGSMLGFVGMVVGLVQARLLPELLGFEHPATWFISILVSVALGGIEGAIGTGPSWAIGLVICALILAGIVLARRRRRHFGFGLRPVWAEGAIAALGCGAVLGTVMVANAYPLPAGVARRLVEARGLVWPEGGLTIGHGLAVPVLLALAVGIVMSFLTKRLRFGRYVFAIGGNPEAAQLSGVNTRKVLTLVFGLMGVLVGISACISTARLNAATNSAGALDELYVIAAAVIGGTSLGGGVGTIAGAMLGALVMQSLQSGMVLIGVDTPLQNIVVGVVLVVAVWLDGLYRRKLS